MKDKCMKKIKHLIDPRTFLLVSHCSYQTAAGFQPVPGHVFSFHAGLRVQVNKVAMLLSSTEVELSCLSGCTPSTHPAYVWLKNGQKTNQVTARYRDRLQPGDKLSCAIQGYEVYSSPAVCKLAAFKFLDS